MAKNRKAAEALVLRHMDKIDPSGMNSKMYKEEIFPNLSNEGFDAWINEIKAGRDFLFVNMPNLVGKKMSVANNLKVAKAMGLELFQRITQTDPATGRRYTGTRKYLIIDLPIRRQIQMITNKASMQSAGAKRDELTGQIAGSHKGSAMSYPETLVLFSQGLNACSEEFLKIRGGDAKASRMITESLINQGSANIRSTDVLKSRAKATDTLSVYLKSMHLDNNL